MGNWMGRYAKPPKIGNIYPKPKGMPGGMPMGGGMGGMRGGLGNMQMPRLDLRGGMH